MNDINLESLTLRNFNKDNEEHKNFWIKLKSDKSVTERFQGFLPNLLREANSIFGKGFLVCDNEEIVGYIDISNYNEIDKCVYLREAIDKDKRGHAYGTRLLTEVSNYIFLNYPELEIIKIVIAEDNEVSIKTALRGGYSKLHDGYYGLENPNMKR